jgi:hypothetical protein
VLPLTLAVMVLSPFPTPEECPTLTVAIIQMWEPICKNPFPKREMQSERWMTAGEATRGHLAYCRAAARGQSYLWLLLKRLAGK